MSTLIFKGLLSIVTVVFIVNLLTHIEHVEKSTLNNQNLNVDTDAKKNHNQMKELFSHIFTKNYDDNQNNNLGLTKSVNTVSKVAIKKPKIAFLFAGSLRSFTCPKVHWSIKSHLIDALGGDSFVFIRVALEDNLNIRTGSGTIWKPRYSDKQVNETLRILNPIKIQTFSFATQIDEMKKEFPSDVHRVYRENDQRRYSMFFQRSMSYRMVLEYEKNHNMIFDWVVLVRLDAGWLDPILPINNYQNDRVWITETAFDGLNDQFMMIPRQFSDYVYNLDSKIKRNIYCVGGPDVEKWKCIPKELIKRKVDPKQIEIMKEYCCHDILTTNLAGHSERIHMSHLKEGQIPVTFGRFPMYLVRNKDNQCVPECFRLMINIKNYVILFNHSYYDYYTYPAWPDTIGRGVSMRDQSLCVLYNEDIFQWKPLPAFEIYQQISKIKQTQQLNMINNHNNTIVFTDPKQQLLEIDMKINNLIQNSVLLHPNDLQMWRIRLNWNNEGCLSTSFESKTKLVWMNCQDFQVRTGGMRHDARQMFSIYINGHAKNYQLNNQVFHNSDDYGLSYMNLISKKQKSIQESFINNNNNLSPIESSSTASLDNSQHLNIYKNSLHILSTKSRDTTRVFIAWSSDKHGTALRIVCLTATSLMSGAEVLLAPCAPDNTPQSKMQLFLSVDGRLDGTTIISTVGLLRMARAPHLCVSRQKDVTIVRSDTSKINQSDYAILTLIKCNERPLQFFRIWFEFELINS
eukprot:gene10502-14113_t